eukprot:XP_001692231.1 predicted protein [Chlamydomonas reinhardtii]
MSAFHTARKSHSLSALSGACNNEMMCSVACCKSAVEHGGSLGMLESSEGQRPAGHRCMGNMPMRAPSATNGLNKNGNCGTRMRY